MFTNKHRQPHIHKLKHIGQDKILNCRRKLFIFGQDSVVLPFNGVSLLPETSNKEISVLIVEVDHTGSWMVFQVI